MKKLLTFILLTMYTLHLSAQNPEQVVKEYVNLMNQYFSTGNLDYRDKIVNEMLNPKDASGKLVTCRIDDKISQRIAASDDNKGIDNITPSRYITKLGRQNSDCGKCLRLEILTITTEKKGGQTFVSAKIKFSGSNGSEVVYDQFLVVGNGIGWILEDKNAELLDRIGDKNADNNVAVEEAPELVKQKDNILPSSENTKTFTINGQSFKMIFVEGGTFKMGHGSGYDVYGYDMPIQAATVNSYYIGETEVTQELWKAIMPKNPSYFKNKKYPVHRVSYTDVLKFIEKLNHKTGQNFRLPTEQEWEYAARGGKKSNDYKYSGSDNPNDVAWYSNDETHKAGPQVVKTKKPNELGIYDMSGNVYEFCSDEWIGYEKGVAIKTDKNYHTVRGGSWIMGFGWCYVWSRADEANSSPGFRLALDVK